MAIQRRVSPKDQIYHLVDRLDDLQHLLVADQAVPIQIVQLERPLELVSHLAAAGDTERGYEFFKVNRPRFVLVEYPEYVICK